MNSGKGETTVSTENWSLDLCGIATFAQMCGVTYDEAAQWAEDGTVPSIQMGCFRMINLIRFRADLERGKATFDAGDYRHE
ncbi:Uncharacterised protein [Pseudomonas aeruginosa]|nr:hypothetical protein [Pseudomonas aeruginosa]MEB6159529.1 hypothetical protein [Pseudomonas aeruginosa]SQC54889.1 Uncharacterised protein [Pseudomonas aeruginosa]